MTAGLLFDSTLCIACGACAEACKTENHLPPKIDPEPTAYTWTVVQTIDDANVRRMCMHCLDPVCASVCPVGALHKTAAGPVVYDADMCIGCRYCIQACPFGVPKYQWDRAIPLVGKCILCPDRVAAGQATACAEACPTGATLFGERDALLRDARERLAKPGGAYNGKIYGEEEAGGTSVLMLAGVPFEKLGLNTSVPKQSLPMLTWQVMSKVPDFVVLAGAFLFGVHWITKRREEVAVAEERGHGRNDRGDGTGPMIPARRKWRSGDEA